MEEILKRIEQVEHMRPDCIVCAFNKYINRCPEDVSASKKVDYMQRVMKRMSTASKSTAVTSSSLKPCIPVPSIFEII